METRFAHLYKRDSSVSMIRVKMSRRRSQTQKENREKMQNLRRHLDQVPELELSMDVSTLEKSVAHARETKENKSNSAAEDRKKMLERFKENKALQKEKEKREKEKKGVFKVGLYRPQPLGFLPVNPVAQSTTKTTESIQSTRVTRSMKQQQQTKLPTVRQAVPKKAELAPSNRVFKPSAPANSRGRTATVELVTRAPTTRSTVKNTTAAAPAKALVKPASDIRALKTRSANKETTAPSAGKGKTVQAHPIEALSSVGNKPADKEAPTLNPSPVKEKKVEDTNVTPASFAPQGFVFQPPSGLKTFQPTPLSPGSAEAFLSPSFCFEPKMESTVTSPPPEESLPPLSTPPPCVSSPPPAPVSPIGSSALPPASPSASSALPPASPSASSALPPASPLASSALPPASPSASSALPPASPLSSSALPPASPLSSSALPPASPPSSSALPPASPNAFSALAPASPPASSASSNASSALPSASSPASSTLPPASPLASSTLPSASPIASSAPPPASPSASSAVVEPQHDVAYFRAVMVSETESLTGLCKLWELRYDETSIPEEMRDRMRTAVGQARLLMKERFGQFSGLVDDCDLGRGEKITTCTDLQGFWDMVYFQVEDVYKKFNALKEAEARGWQEEAKPVTRQKKVVKKPPVAGGKTGAGGGANAAAKSRLAAVKAAMKAKQAAEKAASASASDVATTAPEVPANPAAQTVVFQGGFFQVESPVKVVGARRSRLTAAPSPRSSPCVSKLNTPARHHRSTLSHSSPNPQRAITFAEVAPPTAQAPEVLMPTEIPAEAAPPTEVPHPAASPACTPQRPSEPHHCSPKPLHISPEHHKPSHNMSPTGISHTNSSQPNHDTSLTNTSRVQMDFVNAPADSPLKQSSEIKPHSSPVQSEADLCLHLPEQSDVTTGPEGNVTESDEITASLQEQEEEPMVAEMNDSYSVSAAACASPIKAHTLSFTLSPSSNITSPQREMVMPCASPSFSQCPSMSISSPRVSILSPVSSNGALILHNERSPISMNIEMTENPESESIAGVDFERYLQPVVRCSLSPGQNVTAERFSLGTVDAEMESPQSQAEEPVEDVMMTPTELPIMAPLVFNPWTEQLMDNPLLFTPEQRNRVRQSVCDRDLMMFTPPSSK